MGSRNRSRRQVLKTGAALASIGAIGSLSGCSDLTNDGSDGTPDGEGGAGGSGAAEDTPARADVLMSLNVEAVLGDQAIRGAVNDVLSSQSSGGEMPSSVDGAFSMVQQQAGLDPRDVTEAVVFADSESSQDSSSDAYGGALVYANWDGSDVEDAISEAAEEEPETSEYEGVTVYEGNNMDSSGSLAILDDGTVIFGQKGATEDVIDVVNGDADSISGDLASAWGNTREDGYVRMAAVPSIEDSGQSMGGVSPEDIEQFYGSIYADGDTRGIQVNIEASSEEVASNIGAVLEQQLARAEEQAEQPEAAQFVANTDVSADGTTVTIRNEVPAQDVATAIEEFLNRYLTGTAGTSTSEMGEDAY